MKDSIFDEKNIPQSNWFKFEKVGDRVSGEVVEIGDKPEKDDFPAQRTFVLKQENGDLINVGIKKKRDYLMGRTNRVEVGDTLGFEFKKEIPAAKKGHHPAKSIEVYLIKGEPKVDDDANAEFDNIGN